MEEIRKKIFNEESKTEAVFTSVADNPYSLSYTCLLIPRFQSHYLTGDLTQYLYVWMQQIGVSFGWQLENIDIQPEYMQWTIYVPVTTPPALFMRLIRRHTSEKIFEDFPRFSKENLSKDFWAPGYLVLVGKQLHPLKIIMEFIKLTRQKQAGGSFSHE